MAMVANPAARDRDRVVVRTVVAVLSKMVTLEELLVRGRTDGGLLVLVELSQREVPR